MDENFIQLRCFCLNLRYKSWIGCSVNDYTKGIHSIIVLTSYHRLIHLIAFVFLPIKCFYIKGRTMLFKLIYNNLSVIGARLECRIFFRIHPFFVGVFVSKKRSEQIKGTYTHTHTYSRRNKNVMQSPEWFIDHRIFWSHYYITF